MMWMWKFWRERIIEIEIAMLCKLCTKVVMWRSSLCRVFVQRQDVCGSLGIKQRPTEINKKPKPQQICHEIQIHQPCCKQSRVSFKLKSELRADRQYNNEQWMSASVLIFLPQKIIKKCKLIVLAFMGNSIWGQTFVLLLANEFGKQTTLIKIDAYISLCNIDHDSSDQIVYYMIVEQEPSPLGFAVFL